MPCVDEEWATPSLQQSFRSPRRLPLAQTGQKARCEPFQQYDHCPLPRWKLGGSFAGIVDECRCQDVRACVSCPEQRVVYSQSVSLVLRGLAAE
jgi:hypothetical protein